MFFEGNIFHQKVTIFYEISLFRYISGYSGWAATDAGAKLARVLFLWF